MMEVALVFDKQGKTIAFHEPPGRSGGAIPDSRNLWDILWTNRDRLGGVAHTHPWDGEAWPSQTDVTTFRAVELGLGQNLLWPVVTFTEVAYVVKNQADGNFVLVNPKHISIQIEGIEELRVRSRNPR